MLVRLSLDLPDDAASVPLCRHVTRVILEQMKIEPDRRQEIELALGEAASNVVRHAYPQPGNQYHVEVELIDDRLRLTVLDYGESFVRDAVPDPDEARLGGRGVQLIEQIADAAWYECIKGEGTRLVAEFAICGAPTPIVSPAQDAPPPSEGSQPS